MIDLFVCMSESLSDIQANRCMAYVYLKDNRAIICNNQQTLYIIFYIYYIMYLCVSMQPQNYIHSKKRCFHKLRQPEM